MRTATDRSNPLLILALAGLFLLGTVVPVRSADAAATPAASTNAPAAEKKKKKKSKQLFTLRVHVEAKRELPERCIPAQVGRATPMTYNVEKLPILTENHLERAVLVDQPGGFQVRVKFDSMGTKLLESYTAAAAGRHLVVLTDIEGDARWLAAPLVRHRIGDGTLSFSPDASREEMERLVAGLNKDIEKAKKRWLSR